MIYDSIARMGQYIKILPQLKTVMEVLEKEDLLHISPGFHESSEKSVRYNVIDYLPTEKEGPMEIHALHADVQISLTGGDLNYYGAYHDTYPAADYNSQGDYCLLNLPVKGSLHLVPGMFVIYFPFEPHRGNGVLNTTEPSRKVVFKIEM